MAQLDLHCPNGCDDGTFEALNAAMLVDRGGRYVRHRTEAVTYVCIRCQCVAIDLAATGREMERVTPAAPATLQCPACGIELLPPEDEPLAAVVECPACETRFGVEEGMPRLFGGGRGGDGDSAA